jgi:hypothetical protein
MVSPGFQRGAAYLFWGIFGFVCYLGIVGGPNGRRFDLLGTSVSLVLGGVVGHFAMKLWRRI